MIEFIAIVFGVMTGAIITQRMGRRNPVLPLERLIDAEQQKTNSETRRIRRQERRKGNG